uniref:Uncharacterized protein n=1 Tax=Glossina palpalis gambiensis TaxID=67801 RepID=A0A1B0AXQ2_9MUSC
MSIECGNRTTRNQYILILQFWIYELLSALLVALENVLRTRFVTGAFMCDKRNSSLGMETITWALESVVVVKFFGQLMHILKKRLWEKMIYYESQSNDNVATRGALVFSHVGEAVHRRDFGGDGPLTFQPRSMPISNAYVFRSSMLTRQCGLANQTVIEPHRANDKSRLPIDSSKPENDLLFLKRILIIHWRNNEMFISVGVHI